jgi:hypothetical protein
MRLTASSALFCDGTRERAEHDSFPRRALDQIINQSSIKTSILERAGETAVNRLGVSVPRKGLALAGVKGKEQINQSQGVSDPKNRRRFFGSLTKGNIRRGFNIRRAIVSN